MEAALVRRIIAIRWLTEDDQVIDNAINSQPLIGKILSVEIEKSSNRGIIEFKATNADAPEKIRTPRLEKPLGRGVYNAAVAAANGRLCVISKVLESTKDPATKVRVAYDIHPF